MRKLNLSLLRSAAALVLAGTAALAQAGLRIDHWQAPSGAQVYFVETHVLPILDVQVDFAAGGAYAPADKAGVAGLTHGLLDLGAGTYSEDALADRLAREGRTGLEPGRRDELQGGERRGALGRPHRPIAPQHQRARHDLPELPRRIASGAARQRVAQ